jgi:glycosyltransferase involved in cell wall biosynthesis
LPSVLHILPHAGGGGERYVQLLEAMPGFAHERAWLSSSRSPLGAAPSMVARRPSLRRAAVRHDLIHVHGDMAAMIALPLLRLKPGVVTTHGLSFLRRARGIPLRLARARWWRVARTAGRIACSSQAERDELLALGHGIARERLTVVPNGIELPQPPDAERRRAIRAELGIAQDEIAGLYLGLLDRYKDPLTAVNAAQIVRARGVPFTLLVAGDGPLLPVVGSQAGQAVRVLGFREDPKPLLEAADVFVMPSQREGSSYALLEAMGHGLAIVASDGTGIPEMVGEAAIVATAGDERAFAEELHALASDPARREHLGRCARARACERFGIERFIDSMRALSETVLAGREAREAAHPAGAPGPG